MTHRRVFRLGVIEVGPDFVRYWNRTASGRIGLTPAQAARWRAWLLQRGARKTSGGER